MTLKPEFLNKKRECLEARLLQTQRETEEYKINVNERRLLLLRQEMELEQARVRLSEVNQGRISSALRRLDSNEYGICVCCHLEIAPERLDALPETPFCTSCSETKETEAQTNS